TATLTPQEVDKLLALIRELKAHGIGIIYISHRLDEIDAIADRVMVLRDGELIGVKPKSEVEHDELIEMMVGRRLDQEFPARHARIGAAWFVVGPLCPANQIGEGSFTLHHGHV